MTREEYTNLEKHDIYFVLDNLRSAHNVGSIFRTADAARVKEIVICGYTCRPPHKKIAKTALGAEEYVDFRQFDSTLDAIKQLQSEGVKVVALETTSKSIDHMGYEYPEKVAFVFGNEVSGIDRDVIDACDDAIEIKCFGFKNSLNVSNVCSIVAFDTIRQWESTTTGGVR